MSDEPGSTATPEAQLRRLQQRLDEARRAYRKSREGRHAASSESATRLDVLLALQEFIAELERRRLPVPPTLQREARLLRNLTLAPDRRRRGMPPYV